MCIRIAAIVAALGVLSVSVEAADESSRALAVAKPTGGIVAVPLTIQFSQVLPPEPVRQGQPAGTVEDDPLLTLDEALGIALKQDRGVRTANLELDRLENRIGAAKTRRWPALRIGVGVEYPMVPIDLNFFQGDFGTFPGIGPVPSTDTTLSTQKVLALASAAIPPGPDAFSRREVGLERFPLRELLSDHQVQLPK